jgi:hypothetical protein
MDDKGFITEVIEIVNSTWRAPVPISADDLEEWRPIYLFVEV